MKKIFFLLFLFLQLKLSAQEAVPSRYKNTVSLSPFSLLFGNVLVSYERSLTPASSVEFEVGIKPSGGLLRINGFDSPTIQTNDFEFTGITLTPSYRWYPFHKGCSQSGFYLGGYYRFRSMSDKVEGSYTSSTTGVVSPVDLDMKLVANTFGFEFGYKLPVYKKFSIDFLIAGPGFSTGKIELYENQVLPDDFFKDAENLIQNNLAFLDPYLENIKFVGTGDRNLEADIKLPAFRYAIKIAYSF
jgi:hypothetical protein